MSDTAPLTDAELDRLECEYLDDGDIAPVFAQARLANRLLRELPPESRKWVDVSEPDTDRRN